MAVDYKFSKKITWCGLWAGGIIGPYVFQNEAGQVVTMNGVRYLEVIINFVVVTGRCYFPYSYNKTMSLLHDKFNGRVVQRGGDVNWPPKSCDLKTLDFFLWGYLKEKVYVDKPSLIQELKNEIIRHINPLKTKDLKNRDNSKIFEMPFI